MSETEVALELGKRLLERSTITAEELKAVVTDARRAVAKTRLITRLSLLAGKTAWPSLMERETIRRILSEMDAYEVGQDGPAPKSVNPERKNPEHERQTEQRKASAEAGQPRAKDGAHRGQHPVPAHGDTAAPQGAGWAGRPATSGKVSA